MQLENKPIDFLINCELRMSYLIVRYLTIFEVAVFTRPFGRRAVTLQTRCATIIAMLFQFPLRILEARG